MGYHERRDEDLYDVFAGCAEAVCRLAIAAMFVVFIYWLVKTH